MANDPRESRVQREHREDIIGYGDVPNTRKLRLTKKDRAYQASLSRAADAWLRLARQDLTQAEIVDALLHGN